MGADWLCPMKKHAPKTKESKIQSDFLTFEKNMKGQDFFGG
ncbi:MAG: hypothetical protein CM15mV127_030 [Caudoviricetes sp.]|nr:MAG: hypothetical protein CM15mV127_030 [Caudoviricetes sp.]